MKKFLVLFLCLGSFACAGPADNSVKTTQDYQKLVLKLRLDKEAVDAFVKKQTEACKPKLLSIDGDGFLTCVDQPAAWDSTPQSCSRAGSARRWW